MHIHKKNISLSPLQRNKAAMRELSVGQKVICKHKNGRYYQCEVIQLTKETFYEVNFDDGSFSDNLFPEDIVVRCEIWSILYSSLEKVHLTTVLNRLSNYRWHGKSRSNREFWESCETSYFCGNHDIFFQYSFTDPKPLNASVWLSSKMLYFINIVFFMAWCRTETALSWVLHRRGKWFRSDGRTVLSMEPNSWQLMSFRCTR